MAAAGPRSLGANRRAQDRGRNACQSKIRRQGRADVCQSNIRRQGHAEVMMPVSVKNTPQQKNILREDKLSEH